MIRIPLFHIVVCAVILGLSGHLLFSEESKPVEKHEALWKKIRLKTGEEIKAPLLYRDERKLILDIGDTPFQVQVKNIEEILAENLEKDQVSTRQHGLYTVSEKTRTEGLEELVKGRQEAVLVVQTPGGQGSGFFISEKGYFITNVHVVEKESKIKVTQFVEEKGRLKKKFYKKVKIVALAPFYDLALLKVELKESEKVTFVSIGRSSRLKQGQELFAIGSPMGLERSVGRGILSVLDRTFGGIRYLQTTVQVNPGNSGGPLFNDYGEVVGVINMKMLFAEGLGFAIPSFYLEDFLEHYSAYLYDEKHANTGVRYLPPPFKKG